MKFHLWAASIAATGLVLSGCSDSAVEPDSSEIAAGEYKLDNTHAFLTFKVGHGGNLSSYRVTLTDIDATLQFAPDAPETSQIVFTVNPLGIQTNYKGDYKGNHSDSPYESWNEDLARSSDWLNADAYPVVTFTSTAIEQTGENTGVVTGDLDFLGQIKPVNMAVTFNGSGKRPWTGDRDIIGFDASTTLIRSEWGIYRALPAVGDEVEIEFTGEFIQVAE